jgi:FKBP-type peptidyl-prolyl cis-trans isomerase
VDRTDSTSAEMIKLNKLLVEVEQTDIQHFITKSKLKFTYFETGFWIAKTTTGNGAYIKNGDQISISYDVSLMNGKLCYDYTGKSSKKITIGKLQNQRGFTEALLQLKGGDQATIIIPANMAYGAIGDMNKIPPRATLIYKVYDIIKKK